MSQRVTDSNNTTEEADAVLRCLRKTHSDVRKEARKSGMKLYAFVEKLLKYGLKHKAEALSQ